MRCRAAMAGAAFALGLSGPARADDAAPIERTTPTIVVEGEASRTVAPDLAIIRLGVTIERPTAPDAASANAMAVDAVIKAAKAGGIVPADLSTLEASLVPVYDTSKGGDTVRPKGFRAVNTVSIKVRRLESAGELVGRLIENGANTLQGVEFTIADPEPIRDALRADAMRNARHRAEIYAGAIGLRLGRVLSIRPDGEPAEPLPMRAMRMSAAAPAPMPLEAGTQMLQDHVTVTWAIEPNP